MSGSQRQISKLHENGGCKERYSQQQERVEDKGVITILVGCLPRLSIQKRILNHDMTFAINLKQEESLPSAARITTNRQKLARGGPAPGIPCHMSATTDTALPIL